jgi:hypothetical protein
LKAIVGAKGNTITQGITGGEQAKNLVAVSTSSHLTNVCIIFVHKKMQVVAN